MLVQFDGNFQPTAVILAYYTTFLIMLMFNVIFDERTGEIFTLKYWIGKHIQLMLNNYTKTNIINIISPCFELLLQYPQLQLHRLPANAG